MAYPETCKPKPQLTREEPCNDVSNMEFLKSLICIKEEPLSDLLHDEDTPQSEDKDSSFFITGFSKEDPSINNLFHTGFLDDITEIHFPSCLSSPFEPDRMDSNSDLDHPPNTISKNIADYHFGEPLVPWDHYNYESFNQIDDIFANNQPAKNNDNPAFEIWSDPMWSSTLPTKIVHANNQNPICSQKSLVDSTMKDATGLTGTTPPSTVVCEELFSQNSSTQFDLTPAGLAQFCDQSIRSIKDSDTDTEEEIDVVSIDSPETSGHQLFNQIQTRETDVPKFEAGQSLLIQNQDAYQGNKVTMMFRQPNDRQKVSLKKSSSASDKQTTRQMLSVDHSYSVANSSSDQGIMSPGNVDPDVRGMVKVDRDKIVRAVRTLITNSSEKFSPRNKNLKFRIKFRYGGPSDNIDAAKGRFVENTSLHLANNNNSSSSISNADRSSGHQVEAANSGSKCSSKSNLLMPESDVLASTCRQLRKRPLPSSHNHQTPKLDLRNIKNSRFYKQGSFAKSKPSNNNDVSTSSASISENFRKVRDWHNMVERERRNYLRGNFFSLKSLVPDIKDDEKASKLTILMKSTDYCIKLNSTKVEFEKELFSELDKNNKLKKKLQNLINLFNRRK